MCYWEGLSKVDILCIVGAGIGVAIYYLNGVGDSSSKLVAEQNGTIAMVVVACCFSLIGALSK